MRFACRELTRTGAEITMPQVARAALVSEATATGRDDRPEAGLAVVASAEALFVLTNLVGLPADEAVASAARTARTLTEAAFATALGG